MALSNEDKKTQREIKRRDKFEKTHKIIDGVDHKYCTLCDDYHPANEQFFYPNKSNSIDGLNPYCKKKTIEKSDKWAKDNPKRRKELLKRINAKPKKKAMVKAADKSARERGLRKLWRQKNKDKIKEYTTIRYNKNHDITDREWEICLEYFDWSCAYCGITLEEHFELYDMQLHKEHVIHDGNNYIDNCVPACLTCNTSKHDKEFNEWYNEDNPKYLNERANKITKWMVQDWTVTEFI